ncbi:hypothetical protein VB152_08080 [Xanthomonas fragariae]|nr:hypothetical protein [Xanthomonas fragariae]MEA5210644.1 hypothetical protein [Xanthomonas fragariae]
MKMPEALARVGQHAHVAIDAAAAWPLTRYVPRPVILTISAITTLTCTARAARRTITNRPSTHNHPA